MIRRTAAARRGDDRGAGSVEYLGAILLVVAVVGSLLIAATPIGSAIAARLCEAFGTACAATEDAVDARRPEGPCVTDAVTTARSIGATVIVDVDGGGTLITENLSDGTTRVTFRAAGNAGIGVAAGAKISLTVDDFTMAKGAHAAAGAAAVVAGGSTWDFPPGQEKAAAQLTEHFQRHVENATTPIAGPLRALWDGASAAVDRITGNGYRVPTPTSYFAQVDAQLAASGAWTDFTPLGPADGDVRASGATALGGRVDTATGATTLYFGASLDSTAWGRVGYLHENVEGSFDGDVQTVVAVTLDPTSTHMTNVSIELTTAQEGSIHLSRLLGTQYSDAHARGSQAHLSVDLTNPEATSVAGDLLRAVGVPVPPTAWTPAGGTGSPGEDALATFVRAAMERGEATVLARTSGSSTPFAFDAAVDGWKVGVGVRYENSSTTTTTTEASYFDGSRWVPWTECVAG
ncbi:hypothetical protein [Sanguibacter massiliensis]|uniref:hypothetical protein n=1 Tax=Sanguibacter massiliensis TaxID=1973217 RepID=UPI000C8246EE|nr:hypothetical protein [Sanguibacter massiliensis]